MAIKTYKVKKMEHTKGPPHMVGYYLCEPPSEEIILIVGGEPGEVWDALRDAYLADCLAEFDDAVTPPERITLRR